MWVDQTAQRPVCECPTPNHPLLDTHFLLFQGTQMTAGQTAEPDLVVGLGAADDVLRHTAGGGHRQREARGAGARQHAHGGADVSTVVKRLHAHLQQTRRIQLHAQQLMEVGCKDALRKHSGECLYVAAALLLSAGRDTLLGAACGGPCHLNPRPC